MPPASGSDCDTLPPLPPLQVLPPLLGGARGGLVLAQSEVTAEELAVERRVKSAVKGAGGSLELPWGSTLYHLDDLPFT